MSCPCSGDNNNCGNWINNLVYSIWESTDQITNSSLSFTSGWVLSAQNLGKINNLIDTDFQLICYTGVSGNITGYDISPCMNEGEQAIYSKLREYEFYTTQLKWSMSGIGGSSAFNAWTSIQEWNRKISRVNRVEITRMFRESAKEAKQDLMDQVNRYLKYHGLAANVVGDDAVPGYGGLYGYDGYGYNPRLRPSWEYGYTE